MNKSPLTSCCIYPLFKLILILSQQIEFRLFKVFVLFRIFQAVRWKLGGLISGAGHTKQH